VAVAKQQAIQQAAEGKIEFDKEAFDRPPSWVAHWSTDHQFGVDDYDDLIYLIELERKTVTMGQRCANQSIRQRQSKSSRQIFLQSQGGRGIVSASFRSVTDFFILELPKQLFYRFRFSSFFFRPPSALRHYNFETKHSNFSDKNNF